MSDARASHPTDHPEPRGDDDLDRLRQEALASPDSADLHLRLLSELSRRRQVEEVRQIIRQSSERFKADSGVIGGYVEFFLHLGAAAEALQLVQTHLDATQDSPAAIAVAVDYCVRARDEKRFADRLTRWSQTIDNRSQTVGALMQCLLATDQFAAADRLSAAALLRSPGECRLLLARTATSSALGLADQAADCLKAIEALDPLAPEAAGAAASFIHYRPQYSDRDALADLVRWRELIFPRGPTPDRGSPVGVRPRPAGKINVGFVSPDYHAHPIAYFLQAWLPHRNREQFSYHAYYANSREDAFTERLRRDFDYWRSIDRLGDWDACQLIQKDGIDLLVDLCGYFKNQRMGIFARKPAPVQVSWLGWPGTTGLDTMDYRIVDDLTDPPGSEAWHTEKLIRLTDGFLCYPRDTPSPPPGLPPLLQNGHATFGSTNSLLKLNDRVLTLWGRLLAASPRARLVIRRSEFGDPHVRRLHWERGLRCGLPPDRFELVSFNHNPLISNVHQFYNLIDVALDPYPYTGTTTTFDSLWMGVPVVTLAGDSHQSRVSASILTRIGRSRWVATTEEDYIRIAVNLGDDASELIEQRDGLRRDLENSPWCDGPGFARKMEACFREMVGAPGGA